MPSCSNSNPMIIQLTNHINQQDVLQVQQQLAQLKLNAIPVQTQNLNLLIGQSSAEIDMRLIKRIKGVDDVFRVDESYQLVSSQWKINPTVIDLQTTKIGQGHFSIMAGPCSIESPQQVESIVQHLKQNNIKIMRGGVFKPRSSPYAFRGLGLEGLAFFHDTCRQNGIKIITEVMEIAQIEKMHDKVDVFQVGARNAQNFNLLDALGELRKPVLLKRGISGTIEELLQSAEYIFSRGNDQLMLCERGIRTYENAYRNTFDVNAIALLKEKTHLPVIADPSHGIGIRKHVGAIACAAVMAGANGVIYEVHPQPELAKSDGQQTLNYHESQQLVNQLQSINDLMRKMEMN